MLGERGVSIDHTTIYRWVQRYAPEMEKRLRWQWRQPRSTSWRVDETYVKVRGEWAYLSSRRQAREHHRLLSLAHPQHRGGQAVPRQGATGPEGVGPAGCHQHGQGPNLCRGARWAEAGRQVPEGNRPPAGQVPEQRHRGRPRQAEAADQARPGLQDAEDGLRDDQGLRGDARSSQGAGIRLQRHPRHLWRGPYRRARLQAGCQCAVRSCPAGQPADGTRSSLTEPLTPSQPCVRHHRQIATEPP